jgi:lysophospholipase L1-like esterase
MSIWSLLAGVVFAAETILSPLADELPAVNQYIPQPVRSFSALQTPSPTPPPKADQPLAGTPIPTPTIQTYQAKKSHYTIALLGDSMIDTLGPDAPHLKTKLSTLFPATTFTLLNYGVGGTNIDYGLERLTNPYTYLGNAIPSLLSQNPDVVIIESFGYNPYPFDVGAIDKHWMQLSAIVTILKTKLSGVKIVIAATIAPNSKVFGDGAPGLSFSPEQKQRQTDNIKQYLHSTVAFAKGEHLPLADVFHASLDGKGDGKLVYINGGDHIHYSDAGRALFAQKVADTIITNHLLE